MRAPCRRMAGKSLDGGARIGRRIRGHGALADPGSGCGLVSAFRPHTLVAGQDRQRAIARLVGAQAHTVVPGVRALG